MRYKHGAADRCWQVRSNSERTGKLDPLRISVYGQIVVAITAIQAYLGPLNSMRPALLLMLLGVLGLFLNPKKAAWSNAIGSKPAWGVIWIIVIAMGSAVFGLSFGSSATFILDNFSRTLLFYFLLIIAIRNVRDLRLFVWAYVVSVGILVILSLTVLDLEPTREGLGRLEGTGMFDANDLGMVFLIGLPLAIFLNYNTNSLGRLIARAVVVGIPVGLALTGSRGAMVGLVVIAPVLFVTLSRVGIWRRIATIVVIVASLAFAAPEGYWKQMSTILSADEDYNVTEQYGRVELAKRGVGYMLAYPIFGVGISNFTRAEGTISPIAQELLSSGQAVRWIAPHNTYAQIGAELGFIGLAIWLWLLCAGTIGLWRLRRRIPASWQLDPDRRFLREFCLFLPAAFLAFAVTSFFLSHGYTSPIYILVAFLGATRVLVERELSRDQRWRKAGRVEVSQQEKVTAHTRRSPKPAP